MSARCAALGAPHPRPLGNYSARDVPQAEELPCPLASIGVGQDLDFHHPFDPLNAALTRRHQAQRRAMGRREQPRRGFLAICAIAVGGVQRTPAQLSPLVR